MSSLRIVSRSGLVWNMILFSLMQFLFLHIIGEIHVGRSALELLRFKAYVWESMPLALFTLLVIFSLFQMKKISYYLFALHSLVVALWSAQVFSVGLDKIVLVLLFIYILLSYVMLMMWKIELQEASFRPGFSPKSLYRFAEYPLRAKVKAPGWELEGTLTNWDDHSFYLYSEGAGAKSRGVVDVIIWLNEHEFKTKARVVTSGTKGAGFRVIEESALASRDWKSFYDIIKSRGYINRFV